jgi:hypothetical protein
VRQVGVSLLFLHGGAGFVERRFSVKALDFGFVVSFNRVHIDALSASSEAAIIKVFVMDAATYREDASNFVCPRDDRMGPALTCILSGVPCRLFLLSTCLSF